MGWIERIRCLERRVREQALAEPAVNQLLDIWVPPRFSLRLCMSQPTQLADFAYEIAGFICYLGRDKQEIIGHKVARAVSANSQGRRMLQDDREYMELQRLMNETRKLAAERQKLLAEAKKLERETNLYPLAVLGGVVTAITAVAGVFFKL
ncbi:hypothetical protein ACIOUF_15145 [Pseudomonas iridis]|uniref:Uncharacterized protein n=1 Tax=Pseudomonas iridis TaxID=2710587 RepID=A0ABW8DPC1_9PSED